MKVERMKIVMLEDGTTAQVQKQLGEGGQGEVWLARYQGKDMALKLYFSHTDTEQQRSAIKRLVQFGSPSDRFLWPEAFVI